MLPCRREQYEVVGKGRSYVECIVLHGWVNSNLPPENIGLEIFLSAHPDQHFYALLILIVATCGLSVFLE